MDAIFDGDYYSESEKVKIAARTFDDEVFEWWEELRHKGVFTARNLSLRGMI